MMKGTSKNLKKEDRRQRQNFGRKRGDNGRSGEQEKRREQQRKGDRRRN